jgi:hypothetical protein
VSTVCRYLVVYDTNPGILKVWVPMVVCSIALLVVAIEVRMTLGYATNQ